MFFNEVASSQSDTYFSSTLTSWGKHLQLLLVTLEVTAKRLGEINKNGALQRATGMKTQPYQ
jgi:hypothetical protein